MGKKERDKSENYRIAPEKPDLVDFCGFWLNVCEMRTFVGMFFQKCPGYVVMRKLQN